METICMEEQVNRVLRQPIHQNNVIFLPIMKHFVKFQTKDGYEHWVAPYSIVSFIQPFPLSFRELVLAQAS